MARKGNLPEATDAKTRLLVFAEDRPRRAARVAERAAWNTADTRGSIYNELGVKPGPQRSYSAASLDSNCERS